MTTNQSNQLAKNPNTKKAIAILEKFAKLEAQYKAMEKENKEAVELIKQAMIDNNITKIDIDTNHYTGYITLAERVSYKADDIDLVSNTFVKPTLDTAKVKSQMTLTGILPDGVTENSTQYITKKLKEK
jgi:hypothetical protein